MRVAIIMALCLFSILVSKVEASEFSSRIFKITGNGADLVVNLDKEEIIIERFSFKDRLPTGILCHNCDGIVDGGFERVVVQINDVKSSDSGMEIAAGEIVEGVGVIVKIGIAYLEKDKRFYAYSVDVTSWYEATQLRYIDFASTITPISN